jgi:LysM repeat protein
VPNFKYDAKGNKVHKTESGQTLFNISQIYGVSVDDIKKWNSLTANEISPGQEIIVEKPKEKEIAHVKEKSTDSIQKSVQVTNAQANHTQKSEPDKLKEYTPSTVKTTSSSDFSKVTERGLAEVIDESGENPKFLALHKTASIGTIIQVKNELNNLYIFARVIGKLPETGSNDKLIVKLSKKAYDKLGAVDRRFPVEVSYVPQ